LNSYDAQNPGLDYRKPTFHLLEVKSANPITGQPYRWEYDLQLVDIGDADLRGTPAYEERGEQVKGFNVLELDNTVTNAGGYDPDNIPDDFDVEPISGYVLGSPVNAKADGTVKVVFLFSAVNPIDGVCS